MEATRAASCRPPLLAVRIIDQPFEMCAIRTGRRSTVPAPERFYRDRQCCPTGARLRLDLNSVIGRARTVWLAATLAGASAPALLKFTETPKVQKYAILIGRLTRDFFAEGRRLGDCTSTFERFICRTAGPNPRGISRDARSPAHRAAGPVPVRSRFRDMGRSPCRASGREVPNPHQQRPVCDGSNAGRATGWTSGSASIGHPRPTPLLGSLETARIVAVSQLKANERRCQFLFTDYAERAKNSEKYFSW